MLHIYLLKLVFDNKHAAIHKDIKNYYYFSSTVRTLMVNTMPRQSVSMDTAIVMKHMITVVRICLHNGCGSLVGYKALPITCNI